MELSKYSHKIFTAGAGDFDSYALDTFRLQYEHNPVYRDFVNALHVNVGEIRSVLQIPFLPIRFFKSHNITTKLFEPQAIFESSGTTGSINSRHYIRDLSLYEASFTKGFELFYGPAEDWCIIALLPSYLERKNSSLVYMANKLIQLSQYPQNGFFLHNYDELLNTVLELEKAKQKTILIGVTFALLDFAEQYSRITKAKPLHNIIIMETGGMKGRRDEMIRQEAHEILQHSFGVTNIHSEYGMTELLSQAYSSGDGLFKSPPWMKVFVRDEADPLSVQSAFGGQQMAVSTPVKTGFINVIDLANIDSCSFIATDDAGKLYSDGSFEVIGRMDNSDLRGCSLMTL